MWRGVGPTWASAHGTVPMRGQMCADCCGFSMTKKERVLESG